MAGASTLTSPSSDDAGGATTPTTPVGSGADRLKYGPATGLAPPYTWAILSDQPAYQTQPVDRGVHLRGRLAGQPSPGDLVDELARRPSSISATR